MPEIIQNYLSLNQSEIMSPFEDSDSGRVLRYHYIPEQLKRFQVKRSSTESIKMSFKKAQSNRCRRKYCPCCFKTPISNED